MSTASIINNPRCPRRYRTGQSADLRVPAAGAAWRRDHGAVPDSSVRRTITAGSSRTVIGVCYV